jgi:hypothetical protein
MPIVKGSTATLARSVGGGAGLTSDLDDPHPAKLRDRLAVTTHKATLIVLLLCIGQLPSQAKETVSGRELV